MTQEKHEILFSCARFGVSKLSLVMNMRERLSLKMDC